MLRDEQTHNTRDHFSLLSLFFLVVAIGSSILSILPFNLVTSVPLGYLVLSLGWNESVQGK